MFLQAKHYFSSTKYFIKNSLDTTNNMIMVGMMVNGISRFDFPLDDRRPYINLYLYFGKTAHSCCRYGETVNLCVL